uniref:Uncharacterized protein n=1 Tax=Anguilla anguilla TaxID=7936 RepID=A0A0E9XV52_ANGAN
MFRFCPLQYISADLWTEHRKMSSVNQLLAVFIQLSN